VGFSAQSYVPKYSREGNSRFYLYRAYPITPTPVVTATPSPTAFYSPTPVLTPTPVVIATPPTNIIDMCHIDIDGDGRDELAILSYEIITNYFHTPDVYLGPLNVSIYGSGPLTTPTPNTYPTPNFTTMAQVTHAFFEQTGCRGLVEIRDLSADWDGNALFVLNCLTNSFAEETSWDELARAKVWFHGICTTAGDVLTVTMRETYDSETSFPSFADFTGLIYLEAQDKTETEEYFLLTSRIQGETYYISTYNDRDCTDLAYAAPGSPTPTPTPTPVGFKTPTPTPVSYKTPTPTPTPNATPTPLSYPVGIRLAYDEWIIPSMGAKKITRMKMDDRDKLATLCEVGDAFTVRIFNPPSRGDFTLADALVTNPTTDGIAWETHSAWKKVLDFFGVDVDNDGNSEIGILKNP